MGTRDETRELRETLLCVSAIFLIAATLRLMALGQESLWTDEYLTLTTATQNGLSAFWNQMRTHDPHPPLYFLFMYVWVRILGDGDIAIRVPSALFGSIAPILMYAYLREVCRRSEVALSGALLLAISPMHIWYSQEARPYAMLVTLELGALAGLAWLGGKEDAKARFGGALSAFLAVLALWTHYFGALVWMVVLIILGRESVRTKSSRRPFYQIALLLAGGALPLTMAFMSLASGRGIDWLPKDYDWTLWLDVVRAQWLGPLWSPLPAWAEWIGLAAATLVMSGGVFLVLRERQEQPRSALLLMAGLGIIFFVPVIISFVKPIIFYGQRYMIVALPITLGLGIIGATRGALAWRVASAVLIAYLVAGQGNYMVKYYQYRQKHTWDTAAAWIGEQTTTEARVFVSPAHVAGLLQRYLPANLRAEGIVNWTSAQKRFQENAEEFWIVTYSDARPWMLEHGYRAPFRLGVFETSRPVTSLYVLRITNENRPR